MALKVGPTEAERQQVIEALKQGQTFSQATEDLRRWVEADWFERNEQHLQDVSTHGEKKPALVEERSPPPAPSQEPPKGGKR